MITRHRVWLDGQGLGEVDPAIIVTDIIEAEPEMYFATAARAKGDGLTVTRRSRRSLSVTVRFLIREYDPLRRSAVLEKVHRWAMGKTLTLSHRPGQELTVVVDVLPALSSALKWTGELALTFTAYAQPYWHSAIPAVLAANSGSLYVEGTAPAAPTDVSITLTGAASTLTVRVADAAITLAGLSLPAGSVIAFTHDEQGLLHIACGDTPLLPFRTAASSDDLLAVPGKFNALSCTGDQPVKATFSIKGVWA